MNDPEGDIPGVGEPGPGPEVMMDQDQAVVEALQVGEDVPEDQQHAEDVQEMMEDMRVTEAGGDHHGPALVAQPQLGLAVPRVGGGAGLLLRHASQSSLDESSQKFGHKLGEHKRPPYRNLGHPGKALEGMNSMRLSGLLCDVTLVADSTEVPAHKMVLASSSSYFTAMFTGFTERDSSRVVLQGVDPEALHILVDYVYTSQVGVMVTVVIVLTLFDVRLM